MPASADTNHFFIAHLILILCLTTGKTNSHLLGIAAKAGIFLNLHCQPRWLKSTVQAVLRPHRSAVEACPSYPLLLQVPTVHRHPDYRQPWQNSPGERSTPACRTVHGRPVCEGLPQHGQLWRHTVRLKERERERDWEGGGGGDMLLLKCALHKVLYFFFLLQSHISLPKIFAKTHFQKHTISKLQFHHCTKMHTRRAYYDDHVLVEDM